VTVLAVVIVVAVVITVAQGISDYYASQNKSSGYNPDWGYVPPPKTLPGFPGSKRVTGVTPRQGGGGPRKRWIASDGCILEWDYQHGAVERYSPNGKQHLGEYNPDTGEQNKPGDPSRRVQK